MSRYNPKTNHRSGKNIAKDKCSSAQPQTSCQEVQDIVSRSVMRSGLSYESFVKVLIQSALSRLSIWTQADLERLLLMAERLKLDPLNNEIYAIETQTEPAKKSYIILVVGVDGWSKIVNSHPQFDGMRFFESEPGDDELPLYFECTIFRKDRKVATSVREYMYEVHTSQGAWLTHPRRMLRHKAMIQCARICFGLSGVFDPDEAQRISSSSSPANNTSRNRNLHSQKSQSDDSQNQSSGNFKPAFRPKTEQSNLGAKFVKNWVKKHPGTLQSTPS
jgi:phage recombination protein Bet